VTQAIQMLLHFPGAAASVPETVCTDLAAISEQELGGVETLRELLVAMRAAPKRSTPQLLEEWRERPAYRRLGELYAESMLLDSEQARAELGGLLQRLVDQVAAERAGRRSEELLLRINSRTATPEELQEFQSLMKRPAPTATKR
jgi:hypothetical protein